MGGKKGLAKTSSTALGIEALSRFSIFKSVDRESVDRDFVIGQRKAYMNHGPVVQKPISLTVSY